MVQTGGETVSEPPATGIKLWLPDDKDTFQKYVAYFQEQWKSNLGINVSIESMPLKSRLARLTNKDFQISVSGWSPDYNDPMTFLDLWVTDGGNNHTEYSNPAYDELIKKANIEVDAVVRESYLVEAEKIILEDMPIGPLYFRSKDFVTSGKITGIVRTAFSDINLKFAKVTRACTNKKTIEKS